MRRARPLLAALLGQCSFTDEPSAPAYEYPRESVQNPCTLAASSCGGVRDSSRTEGFVRDSSGIRQGFVRGRGIRQGSLCRRLEANRVRGASLRCNERLGLCLHLSTPSTTH